MHLVGKTIVFFAFIFIISQMIFMQNLKANTKGKKLFALCAQCHGERGEGNLKIKAPSIAGMEAWYLERQLNNFKNGVRGLHPQDVPGLRMRPMARTLRYKGDVENVAEYVASLPRPKVKNTIKGDFAKGKEAYVTCLACHGANAEGNKDLNAPSLAALSDWYLVSQIYNFKNKIRAADAEKDPIGATMAPMAMTLADDQTVLDVVSYIKSLKK